MQYVYVVTEANGATAVAEVFCTWALALTYATQRFANYEHCEKRTSEVDPSCDLATFSAQWDPCSESPDVARRVDISVWRRKIRME